MTKKQFGIIFTLMALIVCVGVLAAKLNSTGLSDPGDLWQVLSQDNLTDNKTNKEQQTSVTQNSLFSIRSEKDEKDAATIQGLNAVISDPNTSQEKKDVATNTLTEKIMLKDMESRIEVNVKNKGFEDALCFIEGNNVRIVVKAEEVSDADKAVIQEISENVSSISDIIIELKK